MLRAFVLTVDITYVQSRTNHRSSEAERTKLVRVGDPENSELHDRDRY